ncbi:MAG: class I SAM-dependent methyltransferase [Candidatus Thiodiazotropha taylori]
MTNESYYRIPLPDAWQECFKTLRRSIVNTSCSEAVLELYLSRITREAMANVHWLEDACPEFIPPAAWPISEANLPELPVVEEDQCLLIGQHQVMHRWQAPLMEILAQNVCQNGGNILEIGFGLGIASEAIQRCDIKSHTIIEGHPAVFQRMVDWAQARSGANIRTVPGLWSSAIPRLGTFDGVLFDPYPLNEDEFRQHWLEDITFAAHFFPHASRLLREDGRFTYYSNEIDSVSREHQRQLLRYFRRIEIEIVDGLCPPPSCQYWWASTMVAITAIK